MPPKTSVSTFRGLSCMSARNLEANEVASSLGFVREEFQPRPIACAETAASSSYYKNVGRYPIGRREVPAQILSIAVQLGLDGDRHVVNGVRLLEVTARSQTLGDLDPGGFRVAAGDDGLLVGV